VVGPGASSDHCQLSTVIYWHCSTYIQCYICIYMYNICYVYTLCVLGVGYRSAMTLQVFLFIRATTICARRQDAVVTCITTVSVARSCSVMSACFDIQQRTLAASRPMSSMLHLVTILCRLIMHRCNSQNSQMHRERNGV